MGTTKTERRLTTIGTRSSPDRRPVPHLYWVEGPIAVNLGNPDQKMSFLSGNAQIRGHEIGTRCLDDIHDYGSLNTPHHFARKSNATCRTFFRVSLLQNRLQVRTTSLNQNITIAFSYPVLSHILTSAILSPRNRATRSRIYDR